jgi:hypothetical protein
MPPRGFDDDMDAVAAKPRSFVKAVLGAAGKPNLSGEIEERTLWRRPAWREPKKHSFANDLVAIPPHLCRYAKVVPGTASGARDCDENPVCRAYVRHQKTPIESIEPRAAPPPAGKQESQRQSDQAKLGRSKRRSERERHRRERNHDRGSSHAVGGGKPDAESRSQHVRPRPD